MANHPKNAYMWQMGEGPKMDEYIMNGAIMLQAKAVDGSGYTKFKAQVIGLTTVIAKGEFDTPAEALAHARKLALYLITRDCKQE